MRLCFIIPYSGPLPRWMPLLLRSMECNPQVDFYLLADSPLTSAIPKNVEVRSVSLAEFERRAQDAVSPRVRLHWGYKLCDLKPFYGLLFPELIRDHDFWGYSDVDLIFGDLSVLTTGDRLADVDIFTADKVLMVGHFTLVRNAPHLNSLATHIPNVAAHLERAEYCAVDEKLFPAYLETRSDIRMDHSRSMEENNISISFEGKLVGKPFWVEGADHLLYWKEGRSWIHGEGLAPQAVLYLHFMGLKRAYHWLDYDRRRNYDEFSFGATGFRPWLVAPDRWARFREHLLRSILLPAGAFRDRLAVRISDDRRKRFKELIARTLNRFRS